MNIASYFAAYRILESDLERERNDHALTKQTLDQERQRFVDAMLISAGKRPVYAIPEPIKERPLPPAAGPTEARIRDAALKQRQQEAQGERPKPVVLPSAAGPTQARARDHQLKQIATDEEIHRAVVSITNGEPAA